MNIIYLLFHIQNQSCGIEYLKTTSVLSKLNCIAFLLSSARATLASFRTHLLLQLAKKHETTSLSPSHSPRLLSFFVVACTLCAFWPLLMEMSLPIPHLPRTQHPLMSTSSSLPCMYIMLFLILYFSTKRLQNIF